MKILLSTLLLSACIYANDIQIFTANSTHINLDKNSKITRVYFGTEEAFVKDSNSYNKAGGSALASFGSVANSGGSGAAGSAVGFVGVLASAAIIEGYNSLVSDNNYVLITKAVNSKNEVTILKTLVISNESIPLAKAEKLAQEDQNKLIGE